MAKYEVIKAHDGLAVGTIKEMPAASPIADYMTQNGYWRKVEDTKDGRRKSDAVNDKSAASTPAVDKVKNMFKRKKK